jgi:hypothetical protein
MIFAEFVVWKICCEFYYSHRAIHFCTTFIAYDKPSTGHSHMAISLHISPTAMHTHLILLRQIDYTNKLNCKQTKCMNTNTMNTRITSTNVDELLKLDYSHKGGSKNNRNLNVARK